MIEDTFIAAYCVKSICILLGLHLTLRGLIGIDIIAFVWRVILPAQSRQNLDLPRDHFQAFSSCVTFR